MTPFESLDYRVVFTCVILCLAVSVEHWTCERQTQYYGIYHVSMVSHSKNSGFVLYSTVYVLHLFEWWGGHICRPRLANSCFFYLPYSAHPLKLVVAVKNKSVTVSQV